MQAYSTVHTISSNPTPQRQRNDGRQYKARNPSWNNLDAHRLCLRNDTLTQPLKTQSRQSHLRLLDLCNLVHVLQGDRADDFVSRVHGATLPAFALRDVRGLEQQPRGRRRAQLEGKGAIWADGHTCGDRDTRVDMCSSGVELLLEARVRNEHVMQAN